MTRKARTLTLCLASTAFGFAACGKGERPATASVFPEVTLVPTSTVTLIDNDTAYLGKAGSMAVAPNGHFFVVDLFSRKVLHYDASGAFIGSLGRQGNGPNEFMGPSYLTAVDDSTLLIVDVVRRDAILWDVKHGGVKLRLPYQGNAGLFTIARNAMYVGLPSVEHNSGGVRWSLPDGTPTYLGKLHSVYRAGRFTTIWGHVMVAAFDDSLAYFGGNSEYLVFADANWRDVDSIPLPRRARRGIPAVIDTNLTPVRNIYYVFSQISQPLALYALSDSRFALLHIDGDMVKNDLTGTIYLTVVDRKSAPRCVDVPLPMNDAKAIGRPTFVGDTLFLLDQYVRANAARAEVGKFVIGKDLC